MDDADLTAERMEREMELSRLALKPKPGLIPLGLCYNCDDKLEDKRLFCDSDCRTDWEKYHARNR